jgi:hypothetical protein
MNSVTGSAISGISTGLANLRQDAQAVAQSVMPSGGGNSLTAALIDTLEQQLAVEASAKVLSTANQMLGTLIDTFA